MDRGVGLISPSGDGEAALERLLAALEGRLNALGQALQRDDPQAVDQAAHELQAALSHARGAAVRDLMVVEEAE